MERLITILALNCSTLLAIALPGAYFVMGRSALEATLAAEVEINARLVTTQPLRPGAPGTITIHHHGKPLGLVVLDVAGSIARIRFEPEVQVGRATILVAYEHRVRQSRASAGLGAAGVLPSQVPPPYRIRSLDAVVSEAPGLSWRHELVTLTLVSTVTSVRPAR